MEDYLYTTEVAKPHRITTNCFPTSRLSYQHQLRRQCTIIKMLHIYSCMEEQENDWTTTRHAQLTLLRPPNSVPSIAALTPWYCTSTERHQLFARLGFHFAFQLRRYRCRRQTHSSVHQRAHREFKQDNLNLPNELLVCKKQILNLHTLNFDFLTFLTQRRLRQHTRSQPEPR